MDSVLEEVKQRVSLVKKTPSEYLMDRYDRFIKCSGALADLYYSRHYERAYYLHFLGEEENYDPFYQAVYWTIYMFGFDPDERGSDYDGLIADAFAKADDRFGEEG